VSVVARGAVLVWSIGKLEALKSFTLLKYLALEALLHSSSTRTELNFAQPALTGRLRKGSSLALHLLHLP